MFTTIPSATLRQLVKLCEKKEALMAQIQEIDRAMIQLQNQFDRSAGKGHSGTRVTVSETSSGSGRAQHAVLKPKKDRGSRSSGSRGRRA